MLKTSFLVILSICCSYCYGQYHVSHGYSGNYGSNRGSRPCETSDLNCIRSFFAQNSACNPVYKSAPESLFFPCLELPIPFANLTFIGIDYMLSGVENYVIKQFYINRASGKLVFEIEFKELNWNTSEAIIRYHSVGKEPVELTDLFIFQHKSISFTLVVPISHGIDISRGRVYTYLGDDKISMKSGSGLVNSDPAIKSGYKVYIENFTTCLKDGYVRAGIIVMLSFIQSAICDFYIDVNTTS